jgi:sulfite reductase (NADPH) flavoprotein alpha-component
MAWEALLRVISDAMTNVPFIPDNAPFTSEQRSWLNGFLAGVLSRSGTPADLGGGPAASPPDGRIRLLILYGSQSGNAESLAKKLGREAAGRGFNARVAGLDSVPATDLTKERHVLIVTSTWGEGDMPDNAAAFWEGLNQNGSSPALAGVSYSVLALGDRNYGDTFCLAGRRLDERLAELGAQRIHPRVECDVDYDEPAQKWSAGVFEVLQSDGVAALSAPAPATPALEMEIESGYTKKNPFPARLIENRMLNSHGSSKDTRHIAFSLEGSGLVYEAGDALGLYPQNCPGVVDQIIGAYALQPNAMVALPNGGQAPLREALLSHYDVRAKLGVKPDTTMAPGDFIESLRKLQPRLYSISSSPRAHPGEVHLTVGAVRYEKDGIAHKGVASTFLADRLPIGGTAGIFIHKSPHFRLPENGSLPVIMVGPGTGIAPFRAFLEERQATGASGKNWLFFGDQRRAVDYLYQSQLEEWARTGHLTKLSLAFSRDQEEKLYVQHLMLREAAELWSWLESGAHFYVCGDASRMAKDVETALLQIIREHGGRSEPDAAAFLGELKKAKRYQRDVY